MERDDVQENSQGEDKDKYGISSGGEEVKMVNFEWEAAEALAGLAHSADVRHHHHLPLDAAMEVIQEQQPENVVKDEQQQQQQQHEMFRSASYINNGCVVGGTSRHPLTETEKEARRLRRVLANRESARQTIRRRQAVFEDLTTKAADLALENENLKREKELATKEYDSLKSTNDRLRRQMAKMVEPHETQKSKGPFHTVCPADASSTTSYYPYHQPPSMWPIRWPSTLQPLESSLMQCRSDNNDNGIPSVFPGAQSWRPDQCPSAAIANPGALFYVLPVPCFFPLHSPSAAALPPPPHPGNPVDRQPEIQCSSDPSSFSIVHVDNPQSSSPLKVETETCNPTVNFLGDDCRRAGLEIQQERGCEREGNYNGMVHMPTTLNRGTSSKGAIRGPDFSMQLDDSSEEAFFNVNGQTASASLEENNREAAVNTVKKPVDAGTSAEARRRRRELMKMKSIQAGNIHVR